MLQAGDPLPKYQDVLELMEITVVARNNKDISFILFFVIGCNFLKLFYKSWGYNEIWT